MMSYYDWNRALHSYFVQGVPRGSAIFLNVDTDVLATVGRDMVDSTMCHPSGREVQLALPGSPYASQQLALPVPGDAPNETFHEGFIQAIRAQVAFLPDRVSLTRVQGRDDRGRPNALAFLCFMVFAASQMAEEAQFTDNNYFGRFRSLLGVPSNPHSTDNRPRGMEHGAQAEEPLWQEWARWLLENSYLPTAYSGQGPTKYTHYPVSQALLRQGDKVKLCRLFAERGWAEDWDADTLTAHIRHDLASLPKHVQDLLSAEQQRYEAVAEAMLDVYDAWKEDPRASHMAASRSRTLRARLYREEDLFRGDVSYYLYPRQARGLDSTDLHVNFRGDTETLEEDRPGWYRPIGPLDKDELTHGLHVAIVQPAHFDAIELPARPFWLLVPDPENPDSGVYASWKSPSLGVGFVIACQSELIPQLEVLRAEHLIEWTGEPEPLFDDDSWMEIRRCMVVSQEWAGTIIPNRDLYEALRPKVKIDISLSGGLRVPGQAGWIYGYEPQVTVFGFYPSVDISVLDINDSVVTQLSHKTNDPFMLSWPSPGDYRLIADWGGNNVAEKVIKIVSWQDLHAVRPPYRERTIVGMTAICGASLDVLVNEMES